MGMKRALKREKTYQENIHKERIQKIVEGRKKKLHDKRRRSRLWFVPGILYVGFLGLLTVVFGTSLGNAFLNKVQIRFLKPIVAKSSEKGDQTKEKKEEINTSSLRDQNSKEDRVSSKKDVEKRNYFNTLKERSKELDARELELTELEKELQEQKKEIKKRIQQLKALRVQITDLFEKKIKVNEEKMKKLVDLYSNMKAQQAAKVLETVDEDLAIEIIGRMKKKNAAAVLNLIHPDKAKRLSERYAGYEKEQQK